MRVAWLRHSASFVSAVVLAVAVIHAETFPPTITGPTSSQTPYVVPLAPGWTTVALISTGDRALDGYAMAGIPDGLGALAGRVEGERQIVDPGYITVFMNH